MKASHEDQMCILRENYYNYSDTTLSSILQEEGLQGANFLDDTWEAQVSQGFQNDSDRDGPNAAWVWSTGNKVEMHYYQPDKASLRKWGYVMWDKERLDQWTVLQENPHDYLVK